MEQHPLRIAVILVVMVTAIVGLLSLRRRDEPQKPAMSPGAVRRTSEPAGSAAEERLSRLTRGIAAAPQPQPSGAGVAKVGPADLSAPPPELAKEFPGATTPASLASPSRATRRHRVRDGETLALLAERYLGDKNRSDDILAANRDTLKNADLLPIGVELVIPAADDAPDVMQGLDLVPVDR